MRGYASEIFFCAVLTFVSLVAPDAAENVAGYRAPVTGAKLGPVQPAAHAPQAQQGGQGRASKAFRIRPAPPYRRQASPQRWAMHQPPARLLPHHKPQHHKLVLQAQRMAQRPGPQGA